MSEFTQFSAPLSVLFDPEASELLGKKYWRVNYGFRYYIGSLDSGKFVDIPHGYLSDGCSTPKPFRRLLPQWGPYGQATVVHDFLCERLEITQVLNGVETTVKISRREADRILNEAMRVLDINPVTRFTIIVPVTLYRWWKRPFRPSVSDLKLQLETRHLEVA